MPGRTMRDAYRERRDLLLELCSRLREELTLALGQVPSFRCDVQLTPFDVLADELNAPDRPDSYDPLTDSARVVRGSVVTSSDEGRATAKRLIGQLFTRVNDDSFGVRGTEDCFVCVIPPQAKPNAWSMLGRLPNLFSIEFRTGASPETLQDVPTLSPYLPLTLTLSGGGVRAAVYQLGVLIFLQEQNRLKDVTEIVSVSGGSILSAHFALHWQRAISGTGNFQQVASELLTFTQSNVRDRVAIPWLWSRLKLRWRSPSLGRTARLLKVYRSHFGKTTLGDIANSNAPNIAIVATDTSRHERVAFTGEAILRFPIQTEGEDSSSRIVPVVARGAELALAVTASSCFPPVFSPLHLEYNDLGLTFEEFKESMYLNDGGVITNLGLEVLMALRPLGWANGTLTLIVDAERGQATRPGKTPLANTDAAFAALSKKAREDAKRVLGVRCALARFTDRTSVSGDGWTAPGANGLAYRTETALAVYRTDLDCPSWDEIHALLLHGAYTSAKAMTGVLPEVETTRLRQAVAEVMAAAGGPRSPQIPEEGNLAGCGTCPLGRVIATGVVVVLFLLMLLVVCGVGLGAAYRLLR